MKPPIPPTSAGDTLGLVMPIRGGKITPEDISAKNGVLKLREIPEDRVGEAAIPGGLPEVARIKREAVKPPLVGDKPLLESIFPQTRTKAGIERGIMGEGKKTKSLDLVYKDLGGDANLVKEADIYKLELCNVYNVGIHNTHNTRNTTVKYGV